MTRITWTVGRLGLVAVALLLNVACGSDPSAPNGLQLSRQGGEGQGGTVGQPLTTPLAVLVRDESGAPASGVVVAWSTGSTGASLPATSTTDGSGIATAVLTLGQVAGSYTAQARVTGATGSPVSFSAVAVAGPPSSMLQSAGNSQVGAPGFPLARAYAVAVRDQFGNPVAGVTVAWQVTAGNGSVSAPSTVTTAAGAATVTHTLGNVGLNTVTATVAGVTGSPVTFTSTAVSQPVVVAQIPVPSNYGIHDTYVRDGIAFLSNWNSGISIYDVGNGVAGGSPSTPILIKTYVTGTSGLGGAQAHNAWWFHNPVTLEKRYLFVGQEGPGTVATSSSGDIHVVDVSDLNNPVEVAFYHMAGAGTHNFWMDEQNAILYAAYYNGGVVALDVSGTLTGDLKAAGRELAVIQPGGAGNTYVWGVMLHNGALYASDMRSGFWKLTFNGTSFSVAGGGNNVPERYGSDLWLHGSYGYTGTWGFRSGNIGNAVKVWQVGAGAPMLVDSLIISNIGTVSDIEVSSDGKLLVFSGENGSNQGLHVYSLADPAKPSFLSKHTGFNLHTVTLSTINGRLYAFGAKNPNDPALIIYDLTSLIP